MILDPVRKKLHKNYFKSKDVLKLAQNILGMVICTNFNTKLTAGLIVETEAYKGIDDKASHAYKNKKTTKNNSMYLNGGSVYIYKCYGIHNLLNIVTSDAGSPDAILIRAIEPLHGIDVMKLRTNKTKRLDIGSGPGKLSKALGITLSIDGLPLGDKIWIEEYLSSKKICIIKKPRIGVSYAGEDAKLLRRFYISNNKYISKK
tara:strand:+ start:574 stop:1182 length:609 start_codon:yes stop_codon:yes gene_type:complete